MCHLDRCFVSSAPQTPYVGFFLFILFVNMKYKHRSNRTIMQTGHRDIGLKDNMVTDVK